MSTYHKITFKRHDILFIFQQKLQLDHKEKPKSKFLEYYKIKNFRILLLNSKTQ